MNSPLPNPRQLLTSILNTLTSHTPAPPQAEDTSHVNDTLPNPLKALPPSARALLTTLHVLIPPPTLLQSLDLLDRGLVTRVLLSDPHSTPASNIAVPAEPHIHSESSCSPPANIFESSSSPRLRHGAQADDHLREKRRSHEMYLVRSSQQPSTRGQGGRFKPSSTSDLERAKVYIVRLDSWNCSCAAFAFASFPGGREESEASWRPWLHDNEDEWDGLETEVEDVDREEDWAFGGKSRDGRQGENVPCCKHLLACLLGERWVDVMAPYVKERIVGREELAGIVGDC